MSVPTKLHLIWCGSLPLPEWAKAWREMYAHWDVRLWDERAIRALPLRNVEQFDWYASRRRWNGAADVARPEILYAHGGVYTDVDAIPLRPLDDAPFMASGFFAGLVRQRDRLANGTIGAEPGHPVLATYIHLIGQVHRSYLPPSRKVGSVLLTRALGCHAGRGDIAVLPPRAFYPVRKSGAVETGDDEPYIQHLWAGSTGRYAA